MRIINYLKDKKYLIMYYFVLMIFVSLVIYLDANNRISTQNIIYINVVGFIFFLCYLGYNYIYYSKYIYSIEELLDTNSHNPNLIYNLPRAKSYQQEINNKLIKHIYLEQKELIDKLKRERRE